MRIYVDTGPVLAYVIENDPNHYRARKILDSARSEEFVISEISVLEMLSVLSRNLNYINIDYKFPEIISVEDKVKIIVAYCVKKLNLKILYTRWKTRKLFVSGVGFNVSDIVYQASKLATKLGLRTLDLLHIVLAWRLNADMFLTLDNDIIGKSEIIRNMLGIEVAGFS
ncbi:MAG: type II toxin-antitoxin system VapC family toxin [Candidatus Njordarchaeota archaeon]